MMRSLASVTAISVLIVLTSGRSAREASAPEYSDELVKFVAVISGQYTNAAQVEAEKNVGASKVHKHLIVDGRGVEVVELSPLAIMYFDESYQGMVVRKSLGILSESSEGEIYMSLHQMTDYSLYNINTTDYSGFEHGNIAEQPYCEGFFAEVAPNVYTGNFDCINAATDQRTSYSATYTCTNLILSPTASDAIEEHKLEPYVLVKKISYAPPDYLLEGRDNFVDPCVTK